MINRSPEKLGLCILSAILLSGCATGTNTQTTFADIVRALSFSSPPKVDASLQAQITQDLEQQHPESALEHLRAAHESGYPPKELAVLYPTVINALTKEADASRVSGKPARAGKLYRLALTNYPDSPDTARRIQLQPGTLHQNIEQCADDLMQQGLVYYRTGHLDDALDTWMKIGSFLPDHQPSLIAIETTRTQLQTLRELATHHSK